MDEKPYWCKVFSESFKQVLDNFKGEIMQVILYVVILFGLIWLSGLGISNVKFIEDAINNSKVDIVKGIPYFIGALFLWLFYTIFCIPLKLYKEKVEEIAQLNEEIKDLTERRYTADISFGKYDAHQRIGLLITNRGDYTIKKCTIQAKFKNMSLPFLTLLWAENNEPEIELIPNKSAPLLIADGEKYQNYAVLSTADKSERRFKTGQHPLEIKLLGEIESKAIKPVIKEFTIYFYGEGVFDVEGI